MKYNFDKIVDRRGTNAMSVEGYKEYLFDGEDALDINYKEDDIIKMWVADMAFEIAPAILDSVRQRVDNGILGYTKIVDDKLVEAFLNWTRSRYGWGFNKEHLVHSQGVIPLLFDLMEYICKPDDQVLIMTPSYAFFKHAADHNNIELITSDLIYKDGNYEMNFEDLKEKMASDSVSLCVFCSPHNPTGRVWQENELRKFGEICLENNVMIISDEIHCDILRNDVQFTPLAKLFPDSDQIITCMAPSKTFNLAGLMFANIIIPNNSLRQKWNERHLPVGNPLSIAAARAAYANGQEWLDELTIYLDENFEYLQQFLEEHLPKAIFTIPGATYLACIDMNAYFAPDENLTLFFANHAGVLLEGGNMFVSNSDGFIRLNLACPKAVLEEGLNRIAAAVKAK